MFTISVPVTSPPRRKYLVCSPVPVFHHDSAGPGTAGDQAESLTTNRHVPIQSFGEVVDAKPTSLNFLDLADGIG